jgi:hypothetical protein
MDTVARKAPWHLWVIGFVSLAWNAFGANDYTQTQLGNLDYFESMSANMGASPQEALDYFQSFPAWADSFWALGTWGALLGSLLLLFRSRFAVWAFAASLIGLAGTTMFQLLNTTPEWASGGMATIMSLVIWSVATFLLIYAISMRKQGVLR